MERIKEKVNKRLTIYNVANGIGIKDRKIISRAGRLVLEQCKKDGIHNLVSSTIQTEIWRGKKKKFNVASYPKYLKTLIVKKIIESQIIQKRGH